MRSGTGVSLGPRRQPENRHLHGSGVRGGHPARGCASRDGTISGSALWAGTADLIGNQSRSSERSAIAVFAQVMACNQAPTGADVANYGNHIGATGLLAFVS